MNKIYFISLFFLIFCITTYAGVLTNNATARAITPSQVAVIVNKQDANSMTVGDYYLNARNIPRNNLITVDISPEVTVLTENQFRNLKEEIFAKIGEDIQVIVLAWTKPYAVNCNSITAAITLGYQAKQCENGCGVGVKNPYFNSQSRNPKKDFNMRLSILLPTDSIDTAKSIVDKGVLSAFKLNEATGYFLKTTYDAASKPREPFFPKDLTRIESKKLWIRTIKADTIKYKKDIMFYFTGADTAPDYETLNFMPGAIADNLTSFGGILSNDRSKTILKWLDAGVTGSYGSVSEPCNYWQKFPNPKVLVSHYLAGETLIEAYWKSVYWPTQGLFIGEPLAAPYR